MKIPEERLNVEVCYESLMAVVKMIGREYDVDPYLIDKLSEMIGEYADAEIALHTRARKEAKEVPYDMMDEQTFFVMDWAVPESAKKEDDYVMDEMEDAYKTGESD